MNSVPMFLINKILLVSLQGEINDNMALSFQKSILDKIYETGAKGVLLNISQLDIIDSYLGRIISETARMIQLLGAKAVLTGMKPYVAVTLEELGLNMQGVEIAMNADIGVKILEDYVKASDFEEISAEDLE